MASSRLSLSLMKPPRRSNLFDLLGGFINDKLSLEDAKKKLLAEQAKPGAVGTGVISSVSGLSDGANALLDNAKKRAEKK